MESVCRGNSTEGSNPSLSATCARSRSLGVGSSGLPVCRAVLRTSRAAPNPLSPPPTLAHAHSVSARVVFPTLSANLRARLRNDCVRYGWPSISQRPNATAFVQPERSIESERRFVTGSATSPIISRRRVPKSGQPSADLCANGQSDRVLCARSSSAASNRSPAPDRARCERSNSRLRS